MNRLHRWITLAVILFLLLLLIRTGKDYMEVFNPILWVLGVFLLFASYTTGLIAFTVSLVSSILAFLATLPLLSSVSAYLILTSDVIYQTVFNKVVKGFLERIPLYQKTEKRVKESEDYKKFMAWADRVLERVGLRRPKIITLIEISHCMHCNQWKPAGSRYCPHCGKENII